MDPLPIPDGDGFHDGIVLHPGQSPPTCVHRVGGVCLTDSGEEDPQEGYAGDILIQFGFKFDTIRSPVVIF